MKGREGERERERNLTKAESKSPICMSNSGGLEVMPSLSQLNQNLGCIPSLVLCLRSTLV